MDPSYETTTGWFTDYEGEVKDAYFGTWDKATDPNAHFLYLVMNTDSPDRPEHTERYSLGIGWSSNDGGETVYNDRGDKQFNKRFSQYAKWINHAVPLLVEAGIAEEFSQRGPTYQADIWKGTRWQMSQIVETFTRKDKTTGENYTNVPVAWLGFAGEGNGQGEVAKVDVSFIPEELVGKLIPLARAAESRTRFLDRVMLDVPEVQQVEGLVGKLAGNSVYETLRVS